VTDLRESYKGMFKVGFNIVDYEDILPSLLSYVQNDKIMNEKSDDINECVWRIEEPEIITPEYIQQEVRRILKTGQWIYVKNMPVWLPPNYYFFLKYFNTGGRKPEFRLNRLMSVYEKIRIRNNPKALGSLVVKSRQIGETSMEMSDALWEVAHMLNTTGESYGMIAMQSMTRQVVVNSCWRTLIMGWNGVPKWLKDVLFSDFKSGDKVAETMKFNKEADEESEGKNVLVAYGAGSHNAFDSINNCRRMILDEWLKYAEVSPYATFLNYEKFIATGTSRKGLFSIFSSPADFETKYIQETYDFWKGSDPAKLNENGTTDTRIHRLYVSPLTGIEGFYDKWGDADANEIHDHIMFKRKSVPKEYRMGEIRAYPLCEEEIFGSMEGSGTLWGNTEGIIARKVYLMGTKYKNEITKEPTVVYGNLEWKNAIPDSDVTFRMADTNDFDLKDARFCFSYLPTHKEELKRVWVDKIQDHRPAPPKLVANVIGVDPVDKRYATVGAKGYSNMGMVNTKFLDFFNTGIVNCPTAIYSCRPQHVETAFEDAIKFAVFTQAMVQTESINSKMIDYFEDRGYFQWLLSKRGESKDSVRKGDAPTGGKNAFLNEIIMLLDNATNTPTYPEDAYLLELNWFTHLLDELLKFNPKDTQEYDTVMSWGQSLLGKVKLLHKKVKKPSSLNNSVMDYLLN